MRSYKVNYKKNTTNYSSLNKMCFTFELIVMAAFWNLPFNKTSMQIEIGPQYFPGTWKFTYIILPINWFI